MTNVIEDHVSRYPMNLQLFAEGDPDPADPTPDPAPPAPDKTFSQAELDRIVAERLARDRKGREDYDDIKTKLTALEQAEADRDKALTTANQRLIDYSFSSVRSTQKGPGHSDRNLRVVFVY